MALRISIPMPATLARDVLASACDTGSVYWMREYRSRYQWDSSQRFVALHLGAPFIASEQPVAHSRIGAARIAAALELMLTSGNVRHAERAGRIIADAFDAPDADICLQFAAFGEVIYG